MTMRKLSNATAVDVLRYHRSLLADRVRTESYRDAIDSTVRKNDVVLDLGCGTGILSLFALRAGAARVYAIDDGPVIELARALAVENGVADRIVFLNQPSYDARLKEKVDVIVTETMGNTGLDEHIIGAVNDARRRWLRKGGAIIPQTIDAGFCPVDVMHEQTSFWLERRYDTAFDAARTYAMNAFHPLDIDEDAFVAEPATTPAVDLRNDNDGAVRMSRTFHATRDAVITGLAVWFRAQLTSEIALTNQPPSVCPSWKQSFFPIATRMRVERGDAIDVDIRTFDGYEWKWSVATSAARAEQSTMNSFPIIRPR